MKLSTHFTIATLLALAGVALGGASAAFAADEPPKSWQRYDERGRFSGSARQTGEGRVRFYDRQGRLTGTAYRQRSGAWQHFDRKGAFKGTVREEK